MTRRFHRAGRCAVAGAALTALVAAGPLPAPQDFTGALPPGAPDMAGWERITGEADLTNPTLHVQYVFYVDPRRPALYSLIRYRVTIEAGAHADDYPPLEKLQWHEGERHLRRFECGPGTRPGETCRWRELAEGSHEYKREVPVIMWLYSLHQRRLVETEEASRR